MFKSLEFDDDVVAELNNRKLNRAEQQSERPPDLRSKAVAIVEAPSWNELPDGAQATSSSLLTSEVILTGQSAISGIIGVAAIALFSIGTTIFVQSRRARGYAAAFGIAPAPNDTLTRQQFVKKQMEFAGLLRAIACVGSCMHAIRSDPHAALRNRPYDLGRRGFGNCSIDTIRDPYGAPGKVGKKAGSFSNLQDACADFWLATFPRFG